VDAKTYTKAVIVAAGQSSRLRPLTDGTPKGLLEVGGEALLARSIRILEAHGITKVALVVGFEARQLLARFGAQCECLVNPYYALCNNMGSLWFARDFVGADPFVYLHSDVIFEPEILGETLAAARPDREMHLTTDFGPVDAEAMKVEVDGERLLVDSCKEIPLERAAGEWIGLALIQDGRRLFEVIEGKLLRGEHQRYDTSAFVDLVREGHRIQCVPTGGRRWKEIDFLEDYQAAKAMFP